MLVGGQFSEFHRIRSNEIWHHYASDTLVIYTIGNDGKISKNKIGWSGMPQAVMKTGTWFAAALNGKKSYCLVGCTMSPGFDYRDWELAKKEELARMYQQHRKIIER
jgi:predicted cupin superfamily sugar epimerase